MLVDFNELDISGIKERMYNRIRNIFYRNGDYGNAWIVATGKTINSLKVDIVKKANSVEVQIYIGGAYQYILSGRSPGSTPPPILPIEKYITARGIASGKEVRSMAFAISKHIGKNGIKPNQQLKSLILKELQKEMQESGLLKKNLDLLVRRFIINTLNSDR